MIQKLIGLVIIAATLVCVFFFKGRGEEHFAFLNWPAIILTGVGPLGLLLLCSDWSLLKDTWQLFRKSPKFSTGKNLDRERTLLRQIGYDFYLKGARGLEAVDRSSISPIAQRILDRLMIKIPLTDIVDLFIREQDRFIGRLNRSIGLLNLAVRLTPSFGMLGTILGMVSLLSQLKDPSNIGMAMSVALLTTFYGLFFSIVIWTPLLNKLTRVRDTYTQYADQVLHWLELLEARKPAEYLESAEPQRTESVAAP